MRLLAVIKLTHTHTHTERQRQRPASQTACSQARGDRSRPLALLLALLRALLADETAYDIVTFEDASRAPAGLAALAPAW